MHYKLCAQFFAPRQSLTLNDVTVVLGVRLHENNPWLIERLELLARHYSSLPAVVIADFGSVPQYALQIEELCTNHGFAHYYINDTGIYSHAICRNFGAMAVSTSHIFFMDLDFVGDQRFFADLLATANSLDMANVKDAILPVPVYHAGEDATKLCLASSPGNELSVVLRRMGALGLTCKRGDLMEFVAPYSNNFLCSKDFFILSGGYNAHFRGHGSEDFEFLLRCCVISGQFPLPDEPTRDCYGPMHGGYTHGSKEWRGFRRVLEALTFPAESAGLKMFHLWHPRDNHDAWRSANDWKRAKFAEYTAYVEKRREQIINCNWLQPKRKILVLLQHAPQVGFFLPLRLTGCDLELFTPGKANTQIRALREGCYEAVAIFNPYMVSHGYLHAIFALAKELHCPTIVVERGALPDSTYYAPEIAYLDREYDDTVFMQRQAHAPAFVQAYMDTLRQGGHTLETNGDYTQTLNRYSGMPRHAGVCFIPLQVDDDIATTLFDEAHQPYQDFLDDVVGFDYGSVPDRLFYIKMHPLSKRPVNIVAPNVILCQNNDNIHALLEIADTVICYNSGVGLLALAHQCSLKTIGNAFYNKHSAIGSRCVNFHRAIHEMLLYPPTPPDRSSVIRLYDWLLFEKYSFFQAQSTVHEHPARRIHHYDNIHVYRGNAHGITWHYKPSFAELKPAESSYLTGKLQIRPLGVHSYDLDFCATLHGYNWYDPEEDGRWGGPATHSGVVVDGLEAGQWRLTLHVKDEIVPGLVDALRVRVNGQEVAMQRTSLGLPCQLSGAFTLTGSRTVCTVDIESLQAISPHELRGSEDRRGLSVKLRRLELSKLASFGQ